MAPFSSFVDVANPRRVGLISVAHGLNEFYAIVLPPLFPLIVSDLDITYAQAGLLVTVFFVMYSVFQLPAGMLADRVGKFRLIVLGLLGVAAGVFLASVAPDYRTLLVAQAVAGISGSTYHPAGMSLVSDLETAETEGRAMGIHGFFGMLGVAAAPAVLGALSTVVDWRTALVGAGALGLAGVATVWVAYTPPEADEEEDDPDAVEGQEPENELTGREPESDGGTERSMADVVRARIHGFLGVPFSEQLLLLFLVHVLVSMMVRTVQTFTTTYLFATGSPTTISNAIFTVLLVGSGISSLWAGSLADRVNRMRLGVGVSVAAAAMLGGLALLGGPLPIAVLLAWYFVLGVVMYAISPVKNALASTYSERDYSGSVFGLMQTGSAVGSAVGPAVFGLLADVQGIGVAYPAIGLVCLSIAVLFVRLGIRGPAPSTV